jgi:hypothetical protein
MKNKPKKVYERVYIYVGKVLTKQGWTLVIMAMDAYSEYAFKFAHSDNTEISINVLNQLFDNILEGYKPLIHPKKISFVTNIPEEYNNLFLKSKAVHHRFKFDKDATYNAMKELLNTLPHEVMEL